jgi:hypothetical protein
MIGSQMVVRLSALHTSHPLPPGIFLVIPRAIVWLEGLGQLKNTITFGTARNLF